VRAAYQAEMKRTEMPRCILVLTSPLCAPIYFPANDPEFPSLIDSNQDLTKKNYTQIDIRGIDSRQDSDDVLSMMRHGSEKSI